MSVDPLDDTVLFRLFFGGEFKVQDSAYKYDGGQSFMESVPRTCTYSELIHKLNEKFDHDLSIKYLAPGDVLDPQNLVSVQDDDDLKELYREYFAWHKRNPKSEGTFRIRLFLFNAVEDEDMTPEDFEDDTCYGPPVGHPMARCATLPEGRSSYGSNLSSSSNPAHSSDAEASGGFYPHMHYSRATAWSLPYHTLARPSPTTPSTPVPMMGTDEEEEYSSQELLQRLAMSYSRQGPDIFMQSCPMIMDVSAPTPGPPHALLEPISEVLVSRSLGGQRSSSGQQVQATLTASAELQQQQQQQEAGLPQQSIDQQQLATSPFQDASIHFPRWGAELQQQPWLAAAGASADPAGAGTSPHLPSHISAFGDTGAERLPSHISAFGEHSKGDLDPYVDGLDLEMHTPSQDCADQCRDGDGAPHTQELGSIDLEAAGISTQPPTPEQPGQVAGSRLGGEPLPLRGLSTVADDEQDGEGGSNEAGGNLPGMDAVHHVLAEQVKRLSSIGDGAFGEVFKAEIDIFGTVAVKWLKAGKLQKHSENFRKEAAMLSRLNHPNVLRFYGIVTDTNSSANVLGIITEYMRGGSLASYLRHRSRTKYLSLRERCDLALHAARGMSYLHEVKVVHFDLKPDNLLIDGDGPAMVVKVADFGLSKHKFTAYVSTCRDLRGTLPYMAPELVAEPSRVSEKADLWSMGVVMWEMLTLEVPYRDLAPQQILMGLMTGSVHLNVPEWCEPEWRGLLEACLDISPARRPSFKELASQLERIRNAAPPDI